MPSQGTVPSEGHWSLEDPEACTLEALSYECSSEGSIGIHQMAPTNPGCPGATGHLAQAAAQLCTAQGQGHEGQAPVRARICAQPADLWLSLHSGYGVVTARSCP